MSRRPPLFQSQAVSDENAVPKDRTFMKRGSGSGIGGGLAPKPPPVAGANPVKPALNAARKLTSRPVLGNITNRIEKPTKDEQLLKKRKEEAENKPDQQLEPEEDLLSAEEEPVQDCVHELPERPQPPMPSLPPPPPPPPPQMPQMAALGDNMTLKTTLSLDDVSMGGNEDRSLEDSVADLKLGDLEQSDVNNPQSVSEYINDIMSYMFETESKRLPAANYMTKQSDINSKMREILVDWLVEVHLKFKLRSETLYLTVNFIDRFLERRAVSRTKLQLVGCTAMLIASKYEEIYAPEVRDFVYISDQAYTRDQILAMESIMLNTLGFHLTVPTTLRFGERLVRVAKASPEAENLIRYLMELTLQESKFLKYKPSEIAAAAAYLGLKSTGHAWDANIEHHAGYNKEKMAEVLSELHQLAVRDPPKYRAVRKKYLNKKFLEVSKMAICEA